MRRICSLPALLALTTLAGGCGKKEEPPAAADPQVLSIPGQQADRPPALNPDNLQGEIDKAGGGVKLVKLDLSPADLPLTMDAPEGTKVHKGLDVRVLGGDHFALRIVPGKGGLERRKRELAGQKLLVDEKGLVLGESILLFDSRYQFGKRVVAGHQDFYVENVDTIDGSLINHSQSDCLLMLKCIGTLAPKTPPPADPAAALEQLKTVLTKGTGGNVTGVRLDRTQATDATLALLGGLLHVETLDAGGAPITDEGLAHLKKLTGLKVLSLRGCPCTDAGLAQLAGLGNLEMLNLASLFGESPRINGPGLASLAGLSKLRTLVLDQTLVDDDALAYLKRLGGLRELYLEQTKVTGPGLAHLSVCSGLKVLSLNDTAVGDAALEHLKALKGLDKLSLSGTRVTRAGLDKLKAALPQVKISD